MTPTTTRLKTTKNKRQKKGATTPTPDQATNETDLKKGTNQDEEEEDMGEKPTLQQRTSKKSKSPNNNVESPVDRRTREEKNQDRRRSPSPPSSDPPSDDSSSSSSSDDSSNRRSKKKKRRKKVKFARNPGMANRSKLLDFNKSSTMKYYEKATKVLLPELFDCESDRLYAFLKALKRRAKEFGWTEQDAILSVPYDIDYPYEDQINMVTDYGVISIHQIRDHEEMYIDSETRKAQDNDILFNCLMESISESARNKIVIWEEDYTVRGEYSGPLLLKVIIRESHLDTNATTSAVQTQLTNLHEYLPTIGSDITKFNTHVKLLLGTLDARGVCEISRLK